MNNEQLLNEAVAQGIITDAQRQQMAALAPAMPAEPVEPADLATPAVPDTEEKIKGVSNLNEIFVTFGVMLLVNAATGLVGIFTQSTLATLITSIVLALSAAEYFFARKRFRLPVLYGAVSASIASWSLAYSLVDDAGFTAEMNKLLPQLAAFAMLAATTARFRVPFLMLPIGILLAVVVTTAAKFGFAETPLRLLLGAVGLTMLGLAVHFDLKDPARVSRWSDFAFWSYAIGSPLFVHSLFLSLLLDNARTSMDDVSWPLVTLLIVVITGIGLLVNRRALILSTLIYVGIVLFRLLESILDGQDDNGQGLWWATLFFLTLFLIGGYVVTLGARWAGIRRKVMQRLPAWPWLSRLPAW